MLELIGGGARSGKSRAALDAARASGRAQLYFIATAEAHDAEMAARIARHQAERDATWHTVEAPLQLAHAIESLEPEHCAVVDCLTLWLSNWLLREAPAAWQAERDAFFAALARTSAHVVLVTNEVGHGIVPDNRLGRDFIEHSGRLHQQLAKQCARVTFMQFGLPLILKNSVHV